MPVNKNTYEMTRIQQGIWATESKFQNTNMFSIGGTCSVDTCLDFKKLELAILNLINSNQNLNFILNDELPPKLVYKLYNDENIDFFDFSQYEKPQLEFETWRKNKISNVIDLHSKGYYFAMYKIAENKSGFLIKIHHLICDGISMQNLIREICVNYDSKLNSKKTVVDNSQDYFLNQDKEYYSSKRQLKDQSFWGNELKKLAQDSNFILCNKSASNKAARKIFDIPDEISKKISLFCTQFGFTKNELYYASISLLISRLSGKKSISFGTPIHGRKKSNIDKNNMTVSTVLSNVTVDENIDFVSFAKECSGNIFSIFKHHRYDYLDLVKNHRKTSIDGNLFDISYNYANTNYEIQLSKLPLIVEDIFPGEQLYSIHFLFKDLFNENLTKIYCDYKVEEYSESQIVSTVESLFSLIELLYEHPFNKMKDVYIPVVRITEKIESVVENKSENNTTIISLFEENVQKHGANLAITDSSKVLSYEELHILTQNIAYQLSLLGVDTGDRVAVLLPKSAEQIATLLSIMSLGAAYIPLEKDLPKERVEYILADSEASLVVTTEELSSLLPQKINSIFIRELISKKSDANTDFRLSKQCKASNEAYLIYTSGSTGLPKGTIIRQPELVNYCQWAVQTYYPSTTDVAAYYTPLTFDLTVTSLFPALLSGASVKVYTEFNNFILSDILADGVATVVKCTPSHLRAIQHEEIQPRCNIKRFVVGGESLKTRVADHTYHQFGQKVDILNEYGPTETVVGCMIHKFDSKQDVNVSVPIGRPITNTAIYILDSYGRYCLPFMKGEIVIAGSGVSAGYWRRPELTAQKFIKDPFYPEQRAYKSGDLAYFDESGQIIYLGRIDNQVKIRGHRVEVEEIESQLLSYEGVNNAAVVVDGDANNAMLKAFVVAQNTEANLEENLQCYLSNYLPHYMVPDCINSVENIPLTFNGKVNISALLAIEHKHIHTPVNTEVSEIESTVLEGYRLVLGRSNLMLEDNFYHMGGDSIKAIQLVSLLQKKGLYVTAKDILQQPTPRLLCHHLELSDPLELSQDSVEIEKFLPTPIMKWFGQLKMPNKELYHQMISLSLPSGLDQATLDKMFKVLVSSYPILNSYVVQPGGALSVNKSDEHIKTSKLKLLPSMQLTDVASSILIDTQWPKSPLFQAVFLEQDNGESQLLLLAHHLVVDGVSWRIIVQDLNTLVEQYYSKTKLKLRSVNNSYSKWIEFTNQYAKSIDKKEVNFWNDQLSGSSIFYKRNIYGQKLSLGQFESGIKNINFESFNAVCSKLKIKPDELLFSVFTYSIYKYFNCNYFTIEIEGIGRSSQFSDVDLSQTVGWFTSTYPLLVNCSDNLLSHIKNTKENMRRVDDSGIAFQSLRYCDEGSLLSKLEHVPKFNYLGDFSGIVFSEYLKIKYIHPNVISGKQNIYTESFDFNVYWDDGLKVSVSYIEQLVSKVEIESVIDLMGEMLNELTDDQGFEYTNFFSSSDFKTITLPNSELKKLVSELSIMSD